MVWTHLTSLQEIQLFHSIRLGAARCVSMQVVFIIKTLHFCSPGKVSCCFLSSGDVSEPEHHYWRPQWHHRVEFKNSRSSARFLSRYKKNKKGTCEPRQIQMHSQTLQKKLVANLTAKCNITCLSFFDFFTFIFIFFPEIMLYLPFFLSFKYWKKNKCTFKGSRILGT